MRQFLSISDRHSTRRPRRSSFADTGNFNGYGVWDHILHDWSVHTYLQTYIKWKTFLWLLWTMIRLVQFLISTCTFHFPPVIWKCNAYSRILSVHVLISSIFGCLIYGCLNLGWAGYLHTISWNCHCEGKERKIAHKYSAKTTMLPISILHN